MCLYLYHAMNAFHDHQQIKHMYFMLTHLQYDVHILQLNALQGIPSHLQHPPIFMQLHKEQNVHQSCYISLDVVLNSKSTAATPTYFSISFSIQLKLPTVIGNNYMRVKIINQRLNLKLITNWSTLKHQKKVDLEIMNKQQ